MTWDEKVFNRVSKMGTVVCSDAVYIKYGRPGYPINRFVIDRSDGTVQKWVGERSGGLDLPRWKLVKGKRFAAAILMTVWPVY